MTLEQVVKLDNIIMNLAAEGYNSGYKTRPFYEEVLRRFESKNAKSYNHELYANDEQPAYQPTHH